MPKVTIVSDRFYGDWVTLYVDGKCMFQGHSIPTRELLRALEVDVQEIQADAYKYGDRFPEELTGL